MKNKVLIKLLVPELDQSFDVFVPVNEVIWKIKRLMVKSVSDLTGVLIDIKDEYLLINTADGRVYDNNEIILNTNIRNGSKLILNFKN